MNFTRLDCTHDIDFIINAHNEAALPLCLDVETTGLDRSDTIIDIQISGLSEDSAFIFPASCAKALLGVKVPLLGHNICFDLGKLKQAGVDMLDHPFIDTMLIDHILDENRKHGLDSLVQHYWQDNYKEAFWEKHETYFAATEAERITYACKDIVYTRRLYALQREILLQRTVPHTLVDQVHSLARSLLKTELDGVAVDLTYLADMSVKLKTEAYTLLSAMRNVADIACELVETKDWLKEIGKRKTDKGKARVAKPEFNWDSPKQVSEMLYEHLALPAPKDRSVDDGALERLKEAHPVVGMLQKYRGIQKVVTSFIDGTQEKQVDGRIYPHFHVNGTVTGRISSSNPNLQQVPTDGEVRGVFVPDAGRCFVSADYSSLEVVLAAHYTQDVNLLKVVNDGVSMHDITAQSLNIPRHHAKTLNFAMQYGCSEFKIAAMLKVSLSRARVIYNKYWETYSGVKACMEACGRKIDAGEPIVNLFGRARHFEVMERSATDKAYRQGFNALIQGTGADITHTAYVHVDRELRRLDIGNAVFPIHDEVLIQCWANQAELASSILKSYMEAVPKAINLSVPLKAQVSKPMERWAK